MRSACFIPVKANSERVPGKNLRLLNGMKLYQHILHHVQEAGVFDEIYVDTNSDEVSAYARDIGVHIIDRLPALAESSANGNDLLLYHMSLFPQYDFYFQAFATAPFLQPESIRRCFQKLTENNVYDSCFTATENHGFYWLADNPINYRPGILPRSQDMLPVIEETTGLYGICHTALSKYHCRIGSKPYVHIVSKFEAVDINTQEDFRLAEHVGKIIWNL